MKWFLLICLVALTVAPVASGEAVAPDVAAKLPVPETVMCATDEADWNTVLARYRAPQGTGGITDTRTQVIHLPPAKCAQLRAPFALSATLAYATLFHEFVHAALHTSVESQADCVSLFMYRYWLRRFFGATKVDAQTSYVAAWNLHMQKPSDYLGTCALELRDRVSPLNGF